MGLTISRLVDASRDKAISTHSGRAEKAPTRRILDQLCGHLRLALQSHLQGAQAGTAAADWRAAAGAATEVWAESRRGADLLLGNAARAGGKAAGPDTGCERGS